MALGVHSEVGRLRKVMVHRPGLEHARLTPSNAEELLFDDVIWVARATQEHDRFVEVMRERGVEVFEAESLLTEALDQPGVRDWVSDHILGERDVGIKAADRAREWATSADAALVAEFLIGGITRADIDQDVGLVWESADPNSMLLPPLPNFLFQRDCSCWIYDGVTLNPMTKPARVPETKIMEAIYRFHPMFAAEEFPIWLGGSDQDWGRCHVEGGDVQPIGNGTVMIGMGERTTPQAVLWIARSLFRAGSADQVLAVHLPKSRSYMHLDTVITMCDRDLVTLFPSSHCSRSASKESPPVSMTRILSTPSALAISSGSVPSSSSLTGSSADSPGRIAHVRAPYTTSGNSVTRSRSHIVITVSRCI